VIELYKKTAMEILKEDGYLSAKIYINDLRRGKDITKEQADQLSREIITEDFDGIKTF
jgi:hypothetical protein